MQILKSLLTKHNEYSFMGGSSVIQPQIRSWGFHTTLYAQCTNKCVWLKEVRDVETEFFMTTAKHDVQTRLDTCYVDGFWRFAVCDVDFVVTKLVDVAL